MCVLSIKVPIQKKSGNLSYAPRKLVGPFEKHSRQRGARGEQFSLWLVWTNFDCFLVPVEKNTQNLPLLRQFVIFENIDFIGI